VGLEEAHDLAGDVNIAFGDALTGLSQDLLHARDQPLQRLPASPQQGLVLDRSGALDSRCHLAREALGLPDHALRGSEQLLVNRLEFLLPCSVRLRAARPISTSR
jgi:hypothetical protein